MSNEIAILGAGMHPWGKWGHNFVQYGVAAAREALDDAGAANQVRALGQQGDSLVVVISDEGTAMQAVLSAARERNMAVIAVSNVQTSALADTSYAMEAWVQPEAANRQHLVELHTGLVNCLVTLVENNLFGTEF